MMLLFPSKKHAFVVVGCIVMLAVATFFILRGGDDLSCRECNVIIIGVDTLRADALHSLGYERETTPTLDALANKGVIFSQAISASSWTVPSFMSIFTGMYPSAHKVTNKFVKFSKDAKILTNLKDIDPEIETFAMIMKNAGYATGGFTGDAGVSAQFGYGQGYDIYTDEKTFGGFENSEQHALKWLDTLDSKQKFFMFFHGYDLHGQHDLDDDSSREFVPEYSGTYKGTKEEEAIIREQQLEWGGLSLTPGDVAFWRGIYDSKIKDADTRLASFIAELEKRGLLKNTVIVLVSDHGEEFYEHKGIDHGHSLYDEQVHVPLILIVPGMTGGRRVDAQVSTMDIAPSILDILNIAPSAAFEEQTALRRSLVPYILGLEFRGYDIFTETDYRNSRHLRSVRTADGWKYILDLESKHEELYDLRNDPGELKDLASSEVKKRDETRRRLLTHMRDELHQTLDQEIRTDCLPVYVGECE
ncbi:MAG: sulfatase [Parcubacteria group bacterium Gr01-1014_8]|nr:MAG: sulfatase [Parcubacteria group bacterium Gr01-1014_8]